MKKRLLVLLLFGIALACQVYAQFSFELIDNFEDGNFSEGTRWWKFGSIKTSIVKNSSPEAKDLIAASCGDYSLNLAGESAEWYVGGIGTDLNIDAARFSRFQIDLNGSQKYRGKIIIELFDDDNNNNMLEQDPIKNYSPVNDDKWVAEVNILGKGFTRISIPFSAFRDDNPEIGDDKWNPDQKDESGGLLKMQLIVITEKQQGKMDFDIDNLLISY